MQNNPQLDIFSEEIKRTEEGFELLYAFEFEKAKNSFQSVLAEYPKEDDAWLGIEILSFWQELFEQHKAFNKQEHFLAFFEFIEHYRANNFKKRQMKKVLLLRLIEVMQNKNVFYLENQLSRADLQLKIKDRKKALKEIENQLETEKTNALLRLQFANLLWNTKDSSNASQQYVLGLFALAKKPKQIVVENPELQEIIETKDWEYVVSFAYVRHVLPLLSIDILKDILGKDVEKHMGFSLYLILSNAEKVRREKDLKQCAKFRLQIKENNEDLFKEYMNWIQKIKR